MRPTLLALAALSTALTATPAQAEVVEIAPSSPWNVDFADDKCRLARVFGEGENRHLVFFEQYWPSGTVGLSVAGPSYKRFRSRQRTDVRFFESQPPLRTEPFTGSVGEYGPGVIHSSINIAYGKANSGNDDTQAGGLTLLDTEHARQVAFVGLKQRGDEVRLLTGPLDEAFGVLNQCTLSLVADWGLDPEQQRSATRMPKWTNEAALARRIQATYPSGALNRGEQGIMRLRVIVNPQGRVEDCAIIKATETEKLESTACKVMQDAIFEPALDAVGQPMRSLYATTITYVIGR